MEQIADEITRLQGCINDLISVLALPAMWTARESSQIGSTLLDVLVGMLRLDFAYARLSDSIDSSPIEVVRLAQRRHHCSNHNHGIPLESLMRIWLVAHRCADNADAT